MTDIILCETCITGSCERCAEMQIDQPHRPVGEERPVVAEIRILVKGDRRPLFALVFFEDRRRIISDIT